MNRTGVQMSPLDSMEMTKDVPPSMMPSTPGDESALAEMRGRYIAEADAIGSVPLPGTMKGALTTGVQMLTGKEPQILIDKLGERLAFERTGTRLYDALIVKFTTLEDNTTSMTLADLQQIRADEARHFAILVEAIKSIGGDPTSQTPCADVAGVESMGLMQVVSDPRTTMAQALHAVLVAEMTDNVGWDMLIALAEDHGQSTMVTDFSLALTEEQTHLQRVQRWMEEATLGRAISDGVQVDDMADANPSQQLH
ncbi:ferritin-like domain-containing protein [Oxalobacteraceae bacterium OM1]|nr:ferritin-like domain-containing protein [Oxalobacteraceae bacterium OM1]